MIALEAAWIEGLRPAIVPPVAAPRQKHHADHYVTVQRDGWWYVLDVLTMNRSRRCLSEGEATVLKYGIALRDLINE